MKDLIIIAALFYIFFMPKKPAAPGQSWLSGMWSGITGSSPTPTTTTADQYQSWLDSHSSILSRYPNLIPGYVPPATTPAPEPTPTTTTATEAAPAAMGTGYFTRIPRRIR